MKEAEFEDCMQRICEGDKNGLKKIYEEYFPYLYSIIYRVVQNRENTEDIAGDFFVKLWSVAEHYQPGNGHKGYLAAIARNMAIDFMRRSSREILVEDFSEGEKAGDNVTGDRPAGLRRRQGKEAPVSPDTVENMVISRLGVQETLDLLNPDEQEIVNMKIMGDMTFREIAETLDLPMGTVTWRYREAIKKIRRCGYGLE